MTAIVRECLFWDVNTWTIRHRLPVELSGEVPVPLAFSPDGRLLAVAVNRYSIQLIEPSTANALATLTPPVPQSIGFLAFSGDSQHLAAHAGKRTVYLWDQRELRGELAALGLNWQPAESAK